MIPGSQGIFQPPRSETNHQITLGRNGEAQPCIEIAHNLIHLKSDEANILESAGTKQSSAAESAKSFISGGAGGISAVLVGAWLSFQPCRLYLTRIGRSPFRSRED